MSKRIAAAVLTAVAFFSFGALTSSATAATASTCSGCW
jgi:hypothetical protein